jgi:hypothetical protein
MAFKTKSRSRKLNIARKLPPSYHTIPGQEFDIKKSEVMKWLIDQPDILNYLWNNIKQSGDVEYDSETGIWTGVDYDN